MGFLKEMYGSLNHQFVRGAIAAVFEYCPKDQQEIAVKEIISDAEIPEDWDIENTIESGWARLKKHDVYLGQP